jgi:tetratricopeptide (TPR) repeat protein
VARGYTSTPIVHVQLGEIRRRQGDLAGARAEFTKALAIDPRSIEAISGLTVLDVKAGKSADAQARLEQALKQQPNSVPLLLLVGRVQAERPDFAAAEQTFRRVLDIDPSNLEVYGLLGHVYRLQGRTDQAIAEFDRLASRQPKPVALQTFIGTLLDSQNRIDDAKKRYEQALTLDQTAPIANNNLAWLIAEHGGNLDLALQMAQTANTRLPDSAPISDTLGWVYYKKGLYSQATDILKETVRKAPSVASYQYHLGLAQAKGGDKRGARQTLDAALALDPKAPQAAEARAALAQ